MFLAVEESLIRASPAELFTVLTPSSVQQVHVIVSQGLLRGSHAVFISVSGAPALQVLPRQFVHILLGRILVAEVLRLAVPSEHAHRPATVQFNGQIYQSRDVLFCSQVILLQLRSLIVIIDFFP